MSNPGIKTKPRPAVTVTPNHEETVVKETGPAAAGIKPGSVDGQPKKEETFEEKRLSLIQEIADKRGNDVLTLGIPFIWTDTAEKIRLALRGKKFETLDVILKTHGGDPASAYKIAKMLCRHAATVNIIVAERVKSAGTLISLCARELLMTEASELGPLDMQIRESEEGKPHKWKSALNGSKALEQIQRHSLQTLDLAALVLASDQRDLHPLDSLKMAIDYTAKTAGKLYDGLNPKEVAEYARNLEEGELYARRVLVGCAGKDEETARVIAKQLVHGYPSHAFVLDQDELEKIGLPAKIVDDEAFSALIKDVAAHLPDNPGEESFIHMTGKTAPTKV